MKFLSRLFWTALAALFLLEAWLWDKVGGAISRFVALLPIEPARRWLRAALAKMPAWAALIFFILPILALEPLKILAVAFIARGQILEAIGVYLFAKIVGVGLLAFIFDACRDKLLTMAWFARLYEAVLRALAWAHAKIDPFKARLKARIAGLKAAVAARLGGDGRLGRRIAFLRRRAEERERRMDLAGRPGEREG